jgi:hypothetical protein
MNSLLLADPDASAALLRDRTGCDWLPILGHRKNLYADGCDFLLVLADEHLRYNRMMIIARPLPQFESAPLWVLTYTGDLFSVVADTLEDLLDQPNVVAVLRGDRSVSVPRDYREEMMRGQTQRQPLFSLNFFGLFRIEF